MLEAGTGDEAQATEVLDASYEFLADADGEPDAGGFRPEGLEVAFNPQYLLDGLAAIDSDTARLAFTKPGKAKLRLRLNGAGRRAFTSGKLASIKLTVTGKSGGASTTLKKKFKLKH